ncbi:MAG: hypothetical protein HKO05_09505 [Erythrobacter sp.]|nr:hypothetical protein [Erythrobacter sp.]RZV34395.1 MAG: hypothetical protein EX262_04605 [Sphingomonadaceae bacterium]
MFISALVATLLMQQASGSVEAVYPDDPTTWTLEYPVRIQPYVADYYDCLRSGSYVIGDGATFAAQYRQDVPRCEKKRTRFEAEANAALAKTGEASATPPMAVAGIFERAQRIHVARGQSLDLAVGTRLSSQPEYDALRSRVAVSVAGDTPRCIARLQSLVDQRRVYMDAEELKVEAIYAKADYTKQDQQDVARYQNQLQRYNSLIQLEQRQCPEAGEQEIEHFDRDHSNAQD